MGKAIELNDANFDQIINSDKPVLVDFWAEWCGPCKMIGPVVEELANDYEGKAVIGKLNVDDNPAVTARFGVRNIPDSFTCGPSTFIPRLLHSSMKNVTFSRLLCECVNTAAMYSAG